jgi:16S rRNA (cytosine967-C5)-methyltransferase
MSIVGGQRRTLRELLGRLRPHWRSDRALPGRIDRLLRSDRRMGSRDRRLYRELVYTALRYLPWIEPWLDSAPERAEIALAWLAAETPATHAFRAEVAADWPPCPPSVEAKAALLSADAPLPSLLPDWLRAEAPGAFAPAESDALAQRAPLWLRLQDPDPAAVFAEWAGHDWTWQRSHLLPEAVALAAEADVTTTPAFRRGAFEVQDLGSQLILAAVAPEPGGHWLDACAGAGGKTLQLAALLGESGRVDVHDVRAAALAELDRRADRAGRAGQLRRMPAAASGYDGVLIDAPCSGTGTWRRAPHLKWVTHPAELPRQAERQRALLAQFAARVRPGGRLIYATCSLCRAENEESVEQFLAAHPDFRAEAPARPFTSRPAGPGFQFWPSGHNGDGFFAAALRRR